MKRNGDNQKEDDGNFLSMLVREVPYEYRLKRYRVRRTPAQAPVFEMDDMHRFRNTTTIGKGSGTSTVIALTNSRSSTLRNFQKRRQKEAEKERLARRLMPPSRSDDVEYPVEVVEWEKLVFSNEIVIPGRIEEEDEIAKEIKKREKEIGFSSEEAENEEVETKETLEVVGVKELVNDRLQGSWEEEFFVTGCPKFQPRLTLYVDDPNLIFEKIDEKKRVKGKKKNGGDEKGGANGGHMRYNIGNDKYYTTEGKKASLGAFGVQHTQIALKIDPRFYRANYTREELRKLYRPYFNLSNGEYSVVGTKEGEQINDADECEQSSTIKRIADLSLGNASPFVIFEYSEEHPFFLSNVGMASLLNNYYRKADGNDENKPNDTIILDGEEESLFFGFGSIAPGRFQRVLTNNLFTAAVFPHASSDFLCVCLDDKRIYARPIGIIHLVGQIFPKEEVFAPHSRRLNQFCKDFLKTATHRVFSKGSDLLMTDLDAMFPYFSEGSKRKWLKEYADCVKRGRENVWVPKKRNEGGTHHFREEHRLVSPECVCQYISMLAEEVRMNDIGIQVGDSDDEDMSAHTPAWALTRNFLNAANGRGLLELRRECEKASFEDLFFSFRRVRLKKGSDAENRKILNEHQSNYRSLIDSIWSQQVATLSSSERPPEPPKRSQIPHERSQTTAKIILKVRRVYHDGSVRIEEVRDSLVAKAYLRASRKKNVVVESPPVEKKTALRCSNCGQSGHMKTNKTCPNYVARVERSKSEGDKKRAKTFLQDTMNKLLSKYIAVPFSNAFHRPVSVKKFPDYPSIVKTPMDFSTIRSKIKSMKYTLFSDFVADIKLILDNCILYNGKTHSLTEIASSIYKDVALFESQNAERLRNAEALFNEQ